MVVQVFLRDDDIDDITPNFLSFFKIVSDAQIPCVYATIPLKLTPQMREFIIEQNMQISQHGYSHNNYDPISKYEFGPSRTYEQQKKDILQGWKILKEQLRDNLHNIFVPPFHGYDENTIKIIRELGMRLSVPYDVECKNLKINIKIEKFQYKPKPLSEFARALYREMKVHKTIGIYTHHDYINSGFLEKALKFLKAMHACGKIKFLNFSEDQVMCLSPNHLL